ncbi:hypothetical protein T552_00605 [Pneumocystis carinii B80]|uniref:Cell division control protein n=1 Tax=Pneumocystis carinii (strain B80) TaxID=1408658 RepID=A0A0W4ZP32_PNEC8|nr:hypothetical protein T552_00605 [Pneumocystis carinii B80]KTW30127.1 hypothetical protein T552_00605 [Pneumocystis carinii B80]
MEEYRGSARRKRLHVNSIERVLSLTPKKRVKNIKKREIEEEESDTEDELVMPLPHTPRCQDKTAKQEGLIQMQKIKCSLTPHCLRSVNRTPISKKMYTPTTPTVYSKGKALFSRGALPGQLIGRSVERERIKEYIRCHVAEKQGGGLYISGPPGTGKTAVITDVIKQQSMEGNIISTSINCMAQDPKSIYSELYGKLSGKAGIVEKKAFEQLKKIFFKSNTMYLVFLDEIDSLITKEQEILYQLFEWSSIKGSRLIIIGAANTLDLAERFLPKLRTKNAMPQIIAFKPYTSREISDIIESRLCSLSGNIPKGFIPFLHPSAIELCSRKVASSTGDLRKAFDLVKKTIEFLEMESCINKKKPLSEISPNKLLSPPNTNKYPTFNENNLQDVPRATIEHIIRVSNMVFRNSIIQQFKDFTLQQKAVLCALSVCKKENLNGILIGKLFDTYTYLCRRDKLLHPLNSLEFADIISTLETSSAVNIINTTNSLKTNDIMSKKIGLAVPEMDILTAIGDIDLLRRFFY